jgi:hypothetical protein
LADILSALLSANQIGWNPICAPISQSDWVESYLRSYRPIRLAGILYALLSPNQIGWNPICAPITQSYWLKSYLSSQPIRLGGILSALLLPNQIGWHPIWAPSTQSDWLTSYLRSYLPIRLGGILSALLSPNQIGWNDSSNDGIFSIDGRFCEDRYHPYAIMLHTSIISRYQIAYTPLKHQQYGTCQIYP